MTIKAAIRRTDSEKHQVGDMYDGIRRYYDQNIEMTIVKLITGDCYFTNETREMIVTIVGASMSVCLMDYSSKVGGMTHVLLPKGGSTTQENKCGKSAIEKLVKGLLKNGAKKERIKAKIFGGGNIANNGIIGENNIEFVKQYLTKENIEIIGEDIGGDAPRRLHFFPDTGKSIIRKLRRKEDYKIVDVEEDYQRQITSEYCAKN